MRSAFFWDVTVCRLTIPYQRLEKKLSVPSSMVFDLSTLEDGAEILTRNVSLLCVKPEKNAED